jgi:hypothetical protein
MICLGIMGDNLEKEVGWDVQKSRHFSFQNTCMKDSFIQLKDPLCHLNSKTFCAFYAGEGLP